jgi:hypothetical protein
MAYPEKLYNAFGHSVKSVVTINSCVIDTPIVRMFVYQMTESFGSWERFWSIIFAPFLAKVAYILHEAQDPS